ncbi:MAG: hypothetical protein AB8V03_00010 [Francisella endosymbiont of Hyalomma asiaticum]
MRVLGEHLKCLIKFKTAKIVVKEIRTHVLIQVFILDFLEILYLES